MDTKDQVLNVLKASTEPLSAGQIAEKANIDRKEVDKAMKSLKESGEISSPKRCYWEAAK